MRSKRPASGINTIRPARANCLTSNELLQATDGFAVIGPEPGGPSTTEADAGSLIEPTSRDYSSVLNDEMSATGAALPKKRWGDKELDELIRLKTDGLSWTLIAKQLDNDKTPVACRKMYAKLMKGQELWTPELDRKLKEAYREERETLWLGIAQKLSKDWRDVEIRVATLGLNTVKNG